MKVIVLFGLLLLSVNSKTFSQTKNPKTTKVKKTECSPRVSAAVANTLIILRIKKIING
jgi:hypothetical protein